MGLQSLDECATPIHDEQSAPCWEGKGKGGGGGGGSMGGVMSGVSQHSEPT